MFLEETSQLGLKSGQAVTLADDFPGYGLRSGEVVMLLELAISDRMSAIRARCEDWHVLDRRGRVVCLNLMDGDWHT